MYKQTAAVSATAALLLIIVLSAQGWSHSDSSPTVLVAPGHWESPNPWVIDPNEYATTFSGV